MEGGVDYRSWKPNQSCTSMLLLVLKVSGDLFEWFKNFSTPLSGFDFIENYSHGNYGNLIF